MSLAVLMMIDGLRPDPLIENEARFKSLSAVRRRGSWCFNASSIMPSVTLPCHMSIFHSVLPARHGVTSNQWVPMQDPFPGLVEVVHEANMRTAMFYSWEKVRDVARAGNLSYSFFIDEKYTLPHGDAAILEEALRYLSTPQNGLAFIYFGSVDTAGEKYGWMTEGYLDQVEFIDKLLGKLLSALPADATILALADHGGHDLGHGTDRPEDMTIPWMIAGPGIRQNYQIQTRVTLLDTAPTIAHVLGIESPAQWDGHCIEEIFE